MAERAERAEAMTKLCDEALRAWPSDGEACEQYLWDLLTQASAAGDEDYRLMAEAALMVRTGEEESRARAMGLLDRAVAWRAEHAPGTDPPIGFWGEIMRQAGDHRRAAALLERAAAVLPSAVGLHQRWGMALSQLGEHQAAAERYRAALALAPDSVALARQLAAAELARGDAAGAARALDERLAKGADADLLTERGFTHHRAGDDDQAIACFEQAVALKPDVRQVHYFWGLVLERGKRFAQAASHFEQAVTQWDRDWQSWSHWAACLLHLKHWDEAIAKARRSLDLNPDGVLASIVWGVSAINLGRDAVGWELLNRAAVLNPALAWPDFQAVCRRRGRDPHRAWARLMAANGLPTEPPA